MSNNILSAPVTEFAFITLKEGKESERGDLEQLFDELRREISSAKGFHGFSWGKSVDPGKENLYILVLGWDSADVQYISSTTLFVILTILSGSLGGCWSRYDLRQTN
jgi:hypothetical protein